MERGEFATRAGVWVMFLVASLASFIGFLVAGAGRATAPPVLALGGGGLGGVLVGIAAWSFARGAIETIGPVRPKLAFFLAGGVGVAGGGGAIGTADILSARPISEVELPIIRAYRISRKDGPELTIETLRPASPANGASVSLQRYEGAAPRPGMCLIAGSERGGLVGLWYTYLAVEACSPKRGRPSTHVQVFDQSHLTWLWHSPALQPHTSPEALVDRNLPADLSCVIRRPKWLYRCTMSQAEKADLP